MRRFSILAAGSATIALMAAGCGSGAQSSGGAALVSTTVKAKPGQAVLVVASKPLGDHLADAKGRTLYVFTHDLSGKSRCAGQCASVWQPLRTRGAAIADKGVDASKVSRTRRSDGGRQVVYAGHPLYRYSGDAKPGDASGQGINHFGGRWYVVSPAGKAIVKVDKPKPKPPSSGY